MEIWVEAVRRAELVAVGASLARGELIRGREGNLSCRLDERSILLTPRGADKGRLAGPDLVRCRLDEPPPAQASTEAPAHFAVYRRCPEVNALVHAHPPALLSLVARGRRPDPELLEEGKVLVPRLELLLPMPPGSGRLAEACASALTRVPVAVVRGHGVFCTGQDVWQALERVQVVELLAKLSLASQAGGARP